MLDKILKLGPELESLDLGPEQFNQKCYDLLSDLSIDKDIRSFSEDLSRWLLDNDIPRQLNVYNDFGQPPVTLFNNETFVVDLYFWMEADTSLHSHAFNGAFKVLFGKSLHENFKVEKEIEYCSDVLQNKLSRVSAEILSPGDCKVIPSGTSFNHRVVHLSSPTVTLCIRTITDVDIPQWHYFDNGLSILKQEIEQSVYKKVFYADYLFTIDPNSAESFLSDFVATIAVSKLINLYEQLTVDTMGLSESSQELLYNIMMERFNNESWYSTYEEACEQVPNEDIGYDERSRLISHIEYHQYSQEEKEKLISLI